jgi:arsenate reductase
MRRQRVVFICIGNACRSQMAEGFARVYGDDVMIARSAGLAPASMISPVTRKIMLDKNVDLGDVLPKGLGEVNPENFDLVINMSGHPFSLDALQVPVREWKVRDPISEPEEVHREVCDQIERLVLNLIAELRAKVENRADRVR